MSDIVDIMRSHSVRVLPSIQQDCENAVDEIIALRARIAELEDLLLPFAELFSGGGINWNDPISKWLTIAPFAEAYGATLANRSNTDD